MGVSVSVGAGGRIVRKHCNEDTEEEDNEGFFVKQRSRSKFTVLAYELNVNRQLIPDNKPVIFPRTGS